VSKVSGVVHVAVSAEGVTVGIFGDTAEVPEPIDTGTYGSLLDLPGWAQERIAVLMLTDPNKVDIIKGIGVRTGDNTFWLHD
jgi:hypothetical protein